MNMSMSMPNGFWGNGAAALRNITNREIRRGGRCDLRRERRGTKRDLKDICHCLEIRVTRPWTRLSRDRSIEFEEREKACMFLLCYQFQTGTASEKKIFNSFVKISKGEYHNRRAHALCAKKSSSGLQKEKQKEGGKDPAQLPHKLAMAVVMHPCNAMHRHAYCIATETLRKA